MNPSKLLQFGNILIVLRKEAVIRSRLFNYLDRKYQIISPLGYEFVSESSNM